MSWEIIGDILRLSALATLGIAGILAVLIWKENLRSRVTYIRLIIQAVAFATIFYLFSTPIPFVYYLVLFPLTIALGRLYCGWVCPFGFLMDITIQLKRIARRAYRNLPDRLNKGLHKLRYVIFLILLLLPVLLMALDPPSSFDYTFLMFRYLSGPFRPYSFLLDPMTPLVVPWASPFLFNTVYFNYPYAQNIVAYISGITGQAIVAIFVILTLGSSLFVKRAWCRFCPTGSSLSAINRFKGFGWAPLLYVEKNEEKCSDCEVCGGVCPMQVSELHEQKCGKIRNSMCILCARCVESCTRPEALKLKLGKKTLFKSRSSAGKIPNWLRKAFLRA